MSSSELELSAEFAAALSTLFKLDEEEVRGR